MNRFKRMSGTSIAVLEIVRIFLALAGGFILITDGGKAYEAYTSQFWPTTTGEITRSVVETYGDRVGNRTYRGLVKYAYIVGPSVNDDERLTSYRVTVYPTPRVTSRARAEAELAPYPKGLSVEVYYNPNRPERSLLKPVFLLSYLIMPVVGLICLAAAFALWRIQKATKPKV